jgi:pyruvate dehydrogenase E1 component
MSTEIKSPLNWYSGGPDTDVTETEEWLSALEEVVDIEGGERGQFLLQKLLEKGYERDVSLPFTGNTPYINTIPRSKQPPYPGDRALERRIKSLVRWNAMAMVVRANKKSPGLGGHISTFASAATLYQVGFHHFFRGRGPGGFAGDIVFYQGHGSPGIYAHAFMEGRISWEQMENFRRELAAGGGLSSYPHPWLMPDFWEYPSVSMGLSPIQAIYQAKFNHYLRDRGIVDTEGRRVWAFLGDGETDEPETLGAITLAAREGLDNLIFVINCNLQRLDGPVRGNGKIVQELETAFRGAGWNVIKVLWGDDWDPLIEADNTGLLIQRMNEVVDGELQKYTVEPGGYFRQHFFGKHPELLELVRGYTDEQLHEFRRGGGRAPRPADRRPRPDRQGLRPGRGRRGAERHPPAEEAERPGAPPLPRPLRHPDLRRRAPRGPLLPAARRQPRDPVPQGAAAGARRLRADAPGEDGPLAGP